MILDQADIDLIKIDSKAWLKIYGNSETTFKSHVAEIAKRTSDEIPPELSNMAGGEIATKQDPKTGRGQADDRRLRGHHPGRQPRPRPPARPPRLRQDRRRHLHPRLVALAVVNKVFNFQL